MKNLLNKIQIERQTAIDCSLMLLAHTLENNKKVIKTLQTITKK